MKTLKTLILFSFLFVCGMNVSADNKSNLIYNSEEVNGMKVAETVYKMDGSTLANYMKYNYKYDDQNRSHEMERCQEYMGQRHVHPLRLSRKVGYHYLL